VAGQPAFIGEQLDEPNCRLSSRLVEVGETGAALLYRCEQQFIDAVESRPKSKRGHDETG
jgi:hypothetical protein